MLRFVVSDGCCFVIPSLLRLLLRKSWWITCCLGGFSIKDETFGLFAGGCCVDSSFFSFFSIAAADGFPDGFVLFVVFVSSVCCLLLEDDLSVLVGSSLIILESECFPFDLSMVADGNSSSLSASKLYGIK